jgi:septal ring factor EnvC (AmiA/AmiB activator)
MHRDRWGRLLRRLGVIAVTVGVIGIAVGTVHVAAEWRAAEAPLDVSPVSMETITAESQAEAGRAAVLAGRVADVVSVVDGLQSAISTANTNTAADSKHASELQGQLARTSARLKDLQSQLEAAQARLAQLNAAAARQAALNAAARASRSASGSSGSGGHAARQGGEPGDDGDGEIDDH